MTLKSRSSSIAALAALLCATTAAVQENRGTTEQRAACVPDAFRFCGSYIPDPTGGRTVPQAEQVRSQRRVPIGVRTGARPGGRQNQIVNSAAPGVSQQTRI